MVRKTPRWRFAVLVAICVIPAFLTGCQTLRAIELQSSKLLISPQQEAQIGSQFAQEIEQEVVILDNAQAQEWVTRVGDTLVKYSPECAQTFTFKVTAAEEINAFAIPGGYCYVNLGLIRLADNEAQVAAVIGHEINHVTARHGVRSIQRAVGFDLLSNLLQTDNEGMGQVVMAVKNVGGVVAMRSFGREDERQADDLGVEAMYKAGYDPRAAAQFFEKLHEAEMRSGGGGGLLDRILSTHPTTESRIQAIRDQIQQYDLSKDLILNTPEFEALKKSLPPTAAEAPAGPAS